MKIVTLTLNPAFDIHCFAENFKPYGESVVDIISKDAGGKGVNISRALSGNGTDNLAVLILGKENGGEFLSLLDSYGVSSKAIFCGGRIRENITIHEKDKPETRISFRGFSCDASVFDEIRELIGEINEGDIVTFTGSLPVGITSADALAFLGELKACGAKIVIDSKSVTLSELIAFKPWLIKPNKDEAESYSKNSVDSAEDAKSFAKSLNERGIENVIISLGENGAVMSSLSGELHVKAPRINAVSTIGAGDSMIAGFIDGFVKALPIEACLKRAVAFGSAACLSEGTNPPIKTDVCRLLEEI